MEEERSYFKVYEFITFSGFCKRKINYFIGVSLGSTILFLISIVFSHYMIFGNSILDHVINQIYIDHPNSSHLYLNLNSNSNLNSTSTKIVNNLSFNDSLRLLKEGDISSFRIYFHFYPDSIKLQDLDSKVLNKNVTNKFLYIRNYSNEIRSYSFSQSDYINRIPDEKLGFHNCTIVNILLPINFFRFNFITRFIIFQTSTFEDFVVNQIIYFNNTKNGSLLSYESDRMYAWEIKNETTKNASNTGKKEAEKEKEKEKEKEEETKMMILKVFEIIENIFNAFFTFACLSIFVSLIIRMILYGASIFIIWINNSTCCRQLNQISQDILFKAIPWIGVYASYLIRTNRKIFPICLAFTLLFVFAEIFGISIQILTDEIFRESHYITREESSWYFYNILFVEFMSFMFIRTRISIKYCPKFITIVNILFLYYYFSNFYPLYCGALLLCFSIESFIFLCFFKYCEMKTTEWNPFNPYIPSQSNPRQCYILVMEKDYMFGFNLWSLFYINSFRSEFLENEQDLREANNLVYNFNYSSVMNNDN